ncbi:unnamed protein product [Blepharisma stoltei]|uniref:Uncharacterized protein n=1 Tax=Blepharisma stoltei TaxID=1481888 RepID=A0AAU9JJT3_9CILI|nr:unnamed protein product [Blepharisma stoltei]
MEEILKKDQYNFSVFGDNDQSLQLILLQNQTVYTQIQNIVYASGKLSIKKIKENCWTKISNFFSSKMLYNYRIKNRKGAIEYAGLSKSTGGKIIAINPEVIGDSIITRSNAILAYTDGVEMQEKKEMIIFLQKEDWKEVSGDGIIFMQTPGMLTEKNLGLEEEISVAFNSLVAFSKDVKISHSSKQMSFANMLLYDWAFLKIKGPGVIYMESTGFSKLERTKQAKKMEIMYFFLFFASALIIFGIERLMMHR